MLEKAGGTASTPDLYDRNQAVEFYESRYEQGYLDDWPPEKKRRIVDLLRELKMPAEGEALDFGCGNGVLTDLVRQALPSWKVYGTEISSAALANARKRYPGCTFFQADDPVFAGKTFDFVFSNHVLEHVFDLQTVFRQMCSMLKPRARMLHILPCGNPGSLEHSICLLCRNGIDPARENRFFYEDDGHVRRLTTEQLVDVARSEGFELADEFYSYHRWGAMDWITNSHPKLVLSLTDPARAKNAASARKLRALRLFLLFWNVVRLPSQILAKSGEPRYRGWKQWMMRLVATPFSLVSAPIDRYWKRKSDEEWRRQKKERHGSEMALFFVRD